MAITNLEALQSMVNLDLPNLHEKVLTDQGITGSDTYLQENKDSIELCAAYVYKVEITHPDFSEGKLRIAVNKDALIQIMNNIFRKNGLEDEISQIRPKIRFSVL